MKLESVSIERFRSVESSELTNCGGFNVLIGKNNSGKSNILSAIHAFFTCIQGGDVVTLDSPIGQEIDFFEKKTQLPIEITLTFSLSLAERDALIRDIVMDAPQMKNAVDGLDPSLRLSATLIADIKTSVDGKKHSVRPWRSGTRIASKPASSASSVSRKS